MRRLILPVVLVAAAALPDRAVAVPRTITQSTDTATVRPGHTLYCLELPGGYHDENRLLRRFELMMDHGITRTFDVISVDIGIQEATAGNGVSQPLEINLYAIDRAAPLEFGNLSLVGSATADLADQLVTVVNVPVIGMLADPMADDLVVEARAPDGRARQNTLIIGTNRNGETRTSYVAADGCGFPEPVPFAAFGAVQPTHTVMVVHGDEAMPLAVHFDYAHAVWLGDSAVEVSWGTLLEQDTRAFVVERDDGWGFAAIGDPVRAEGAGYRYRFVDLEPLAGAMPWYRVVERSTSGAGDSTAPFTVEPLSEVPADRGSRVRSRAPRRGVRD